MTLQFQGKKATFYHSLGQPEKLPIRDQQIPIPNVGDGGIMIVET